MTPEHLACPDHNSQLEPLRRAIESGVGTRDVPDDRDRRSQEEDDDPRNPSGRRYLSGYSSQDTRFIHPARYTTSLENPLLFRLTAEEYRTLRNYQEQRALPDRFLGQNPAQDNALHAPMHPPPANPSFQTTSQEYGKYQPNVHTMPYSYHGLDTRFTARKSTQGNYRNHSLNL